LLPIAAQNPQTRPVGSASFGTNLFKMLLAEQQLVFTDSIFRICKMIAQVGATVQQQKNDRLNIEATGFSSDALLQSLSAATTLSSTNQYSEYRYIGIYGRLNFDCR